MKILPHVKDLKDCGQRREQPGVLLPMVFDLEGTELSWFSTIATFGTPQDITVQELRIECLFPADEVDDDDYFNDQLTIKKVEPGMIVFDASLDGEEDIVISLPKSVTSKAKAGWSVTMEIARIKGKWGILGIGNVYP